MYKKFFHLREDPFNVNPDPRFLFHTSETEEAFSCLTYGIQKRRGFILLTGEVGTGKTTLLNKLLDSLRGNRVVTSLVFNPRLSVEEFLEFTMADFGIDCAWERKSQALLCLNQWLLERYEAGENAVLIIDEAQNLSLDVLEEIRLLTNLETSTDKLLQIVLSGQPELEQQLKQPQLRHLWHRITLRCKTSLLKAEETRAYIAERLRIAGAYGRPLFTSEATNAVHLYAQGTPRVINMLCENALIAAFRQGQKRVSAAIVEGVAAEFGLFPAGESGLSPTSEYQVMPHTQESLLERVVVMGR